jgi:hypothetical protein
MQVAVVVVEEQLLHQQVEQEALAVVAQVVMV